MGGKKHSSSDLWSEQQTKILIEFFKERDHLFDPVHPNFFKKIHRDDAMREIWKLLGQIFTIREISDKFRGLRTIYCKEKTKLEKVGIHNIEEQVKNCRWNLFGDLTFLNDAVSRGKVNDPLNSSDSELKESLDFDGASVSNEAQSPPSGLDLESDTERIVPCTNSTKGNLLPVLKVKRMKRKANDECFNGNVRNVGQSSSNQAMVDESVDHFSMFVRSQLKAIEDAKARHLAMLEITQILTNRLCPDFTFVTHQINE